MVKTFMKRFVSGAVAAVVVAASVPLINRITSAQTYPENFVYADNGRFMCDGSPYYYGGTNCYYLTYKSDSEVKNVFDDAKDMGLKVIRVWGNLDVGRKTGSTDKNGHPVFEGNNDGEGQKDGIYFQYWDDEMQKPVVNEGADGLRKLDYVIKQAEEHDMKLIITFTNYWEAFGGMGQYVKWLQMKNGQSVSNGAVSGNDCCQFYTNETLKGWYKDYIKTLLNHENYYTREKLMDSEAVFAWELSNEPRCGIDKECKDDILYNWASEMSAYVKSLDPYHMVSVGDEGFFNWKYEEATSNDRNHYIYAGAEGVDFTKLMSIDTIDFGTPHMYMEDWGVSNKNGDANWITDHAEVAVAANKPLIMEEFGEKNKSERDAKMQKWLDLFVDQYQGFNYWMIASYLDDGTLYQDYDGYTVYGPTGTVTDTTRKLIVDASERMHKKGLVNFTDATQYDYDRASGRGVTINVTVNEGSISGVEFNGKKLSSSDYSKNGNVITLKDSFLKKQELTTYNAKILMTAGNSPKFSVTTTDSKLPTPAIAPTDVSIDVNPKVCSDVAITMDKKTSEFRGLVFNNEKLSENADYTVNGDTVTLNASFLRTLSKGENKIVFDFYEGADSVLTVNVSDTTGLDEFDTYEKYENDDAVWAFYTRNTGGNELGLNLVSKNGSQKLAFSYDVGSPNGYCGVNRAIAARDMSSFKGIEFEIEGDGSGNSFTLQIRDANDNYFEKEIKVNFTGVKTVRVPFEEFAAPGWQTSGGTLDTTKINQFSLYAGKSGNTDTGTYYIDNIVGYTGDDPDDEDAYIVDPNKTYDGKTSGVSVDIVLNGKSVTSVSNNGKTLVNGTDYTISGGNVTIKDNYLAALDNGTYDIVFKFSNNKEATLKLTVKKGEEIHVHSYTSKVTKEATCTEKGVVTYTCDCGEKYTEAIPSLGHDMKFAGKVEPTETEPGYSIYKCERCGQTEKREFVDPIKPHIHNYTSKITKEATCTTDGIITYTCDCGDTYTETIRAKGHSESDWIVDKQPTANESGSKHTECTVCGATLKTEVIAPTGGDDKEKTTNIFSGSAACGSWNQAVTLDTEKIGGNFDPSVFTKDGYVYVEYSGDGSIGLILQSWSGAEGWARVTPCEIGSANGHKYAKFSYDEMVSAFGSSDFSGKLDRFHIAANECGITVYNASYVSGGNDGGNDDDHKEDDKPTESDPYVSIFWGEASCGAWGQAVSADTAKNGGSFNVSSITADSYIYVEYVGSDLELVLQSWSGGANWAKVQAFEYGTANGHSYAKFSYDDMVSAYGSDLGTLDKLHVGAKDCNITVYSVCCCYPR